MGNGVLPRRTVTRSPCAIGNWTWPSITRTVSASLREVQLVDLVCAVDERARG